MNSPKRKARPRVGFQLGALSFELPQSLRASYREASVTKQVFDLIKGAEALQLVQDQQRPRETTVAVARRKGGDVDSLAGSAGEYDDVLFDHFPSSDGFQQGGGFALAAGKDIAQGERATVPV